MVGWCSMGTSVMTHDFTGKPIPTDTRALSGASSKSMPPTYRPTPGTSICWNVKMWEPNICFSTVLQDLFIIYILYIQYIYIYVYVYVYIYNLFRFLGVFWRDGFWTNGVTLWGEYRLQRGTLHAGAGNHGVAIGWGVFCEYRWVNGWVFGQKWRTVSYPVDRK